MTDIGFIGLGIMGSRMAARLIAAGHNLVVHDLSETAVVELVAKGVSAAKSAAEVASRSDVVVLSLPTPNVVEAVLSGPSGVIEGTRAKTVIDTSTTGSQVITRAAPKLAAKGMTLIDAPVSGGVAGAANGTLTVMVGGDPATFEAVRPILEIIGKNVMHMGDKPGLGQAMKLVNNMLSAAGTLAAMEVLVAGAKAGLDPQKMLDVINTSSGRCFGTEVKIPECILPGTFPMRFSTDLLHKDVNLGVAEAEAMGARMWVVKCARDLLAYSKERGDGPLDYAHIITYFEEWAGGDAKVRAKTDGA
jgi:3-hydroxyisobutyrate dehydrogenase